MVLRTDWKKPPKEKKPYKGISRIPKNRGEAQMFAQIWKQRKHICNNCKDPLGNIALVIYFSHIIPKVRGEQYRLDPNNIQLLCADCHYAFDFQGEDKFNERKK